MPNWCTNTLTISGSEKELLRFLNKGRRNSNLPRRASIAKALHDHPDDRQEFMLTDWIVRPEIVNRYDLTNYSAISNSKYRKLVKVGDKMDTTGTVVTQEILDDMIAIEKKQLKKFGVVGWYDWNIKYLGTKWDAEMNLRLNEDRDIVGEFDTAWSPCIAWLENICPKFPELSFNLKYYEPGCAFCGEVNAEDGCIYIDGSEELTEENAEYYGCSWIFEDEDED